MPRGVSNHRKRLLRLLSTEDLERLRPEGAHGTSIDALTEVWSPEIENIIREAIDGYFVIARAEAEAAQNKGRRGLKVVGKS